MFPTDDAPTFTTDHLREALRVCYDPELNVNIIDLGLVYDVQLSLDEDAPGYEPRYIADITLTMRAPSEEREPLLIAQVQNRLAGLHAISRSNVQMVWEPAWSADRMSAAARQQLGLDRPAKQGLINIRL